MFTEILSPVGKRKRPASNFGIRLRAIREGKDLTVAALAEKAGMQHQSVSRLERGEVEPTWPTVTKLAEALGVTPDAFLPEGEPEG